MPVMDTHALVIGIAEYLHINPLPAIVRQDALDIRDLLVDPGRCGSPGENVRLLLDGQATREAILAALADLAARAGPDSAVFIYISSHGGQVTSGALAGEYLLPVDTVLSSYDELARTAISGDQFTAALGSENDAEALRRRLQLKMLLFEMGETFRVLLLEKTGQK